MISVPSRRLLSNGNSILLSILVSFSFLSCSTAKSSAKDPAGSQNVQIVKADKSSNRKDTIPAVSKTKYASLPDTFFWTRDTSFQTIRIAQKRTPVSRKDSKKSHLTIKLFIPLNSDGISEQQAAVSEYVHFYAGMLLAAEDLSNKGISFTLDVTDTEEGKFDARKAAENLEETLPDIIIGPFEREDIKILAEKARELQIPLLSPWQTSTKITAENPWYIQLKPNLKAHYQKIAEHVFKNYQKGEVAVIGRNTNDFTSWYNYFEELAKERNKSGNDNYFIKYLVNNDSLITGPTAFTRLFANNKLKAVIIPNFSFNDELFAYNSVRKLSVEKGARTLVAYGMPLIYHSDRIEYEHLASLSMRVVMSDFVDETNYEVRQFRKRFLDAFGEIALPSAIRGYDVMWYAGELLQQSDFSPALRPDKFVFTGIQQNFDIIKVRADEKPVNPDSLEFDFFENKKLNIIEFYDSKFKRID